MAVKAVRLAGPFGESVFFKLFLAVYKLYFAFYNLLGRGRGDCFYNNGKIDCFDSTEPGCYDDDDDVVE